MVLVRDVQALPAIKGHGHGPGELPVTAAKAIAKLSQVFLVQSADGHTDGGSPRRVTPVQHENASIPTRGHIVVFGIAASVEPIVHNPDGLDILQRDGWHIRLSSNCSHPWFVADV